MLAVMVSEAEKRHSLTRPATDVPSDVMVVAPVIVTDSASAVPKSVVEAEASAADETAFVERTIA